MRCSIERWKSCPLSRRNDSDFRTLFWDHWLETNKAFRLPTVARRVWEVVQGQYGSRVETLPHANYMTAMFSAADSSWAEGNPQGLIDIRKAIFRTIEVIIANKEVAACLNGVYEMTPGKTARPALDGYCDRRGH